jgi:chemotaxis protein MotA
VDLATIIGLVLGVGAVLMSVVIEGGHLSSLVNLSAAVIVFGGTLGATMASSPLERLIALPKVIMQAFFNRLPHPSTAIQTLIKLAHKARRDGVLSLERELESIHDDFLRQGIQLVVDGSDPEVVHDTLATQTAAMAARHRAAAEVFTTMGGFAPTLGIIGTVMGLVHMLGKLTEPGNMGPAIAAAFIATLYGVASANLVFLPLAGKLQARSKAELALRDMVLEGILSIQAGQSPRTLEDRLRAHLSPAQRRALSQPQSSPGAPAQEGVQALEQAGA